MYDPPLGKMQRPTLSLAQLATETNTTSFLPAGLGAPKAKEWFTGPNQAHGMGLESPTKLPMWSATTGILRSDGCVSGTSATATPYFPVPAARSDAFPIPNCVMSSRRFIFSNIYRVGPEIIEHQHLQ